ncbi:TRAP transporter small permease [Roseovarius pacificus]|uniref:TRAP transporter small permease n=1 Tax=Roseovarius pacificus TaxID=337701 RepID=UPI002A1897FF|nr:TRAP transporter small permease [Roseovarius pacificus]
MSDGRHSSDAASARRETRLARVLAAIDWSIRKLVDISLWIAATCIIVILTIGTVETIGRAIWGWSFLGSVEITQAFLATAIFASLAYVQKRNEHVVVDIFSSHYGPRVSRILTFFILVLSLIALALLTWRTGVTALRGWRLNEIAQGFIPVPIWLAKCIATASLGIACVETLRQLVRAISGLEPSGENKRKAEHSLPELRDS